MQPDEFADLVVTTIKLALAPVLERQAAQDVRVAALERTPLAATKDDLVSLEQTVVTLREKVAVLESKPPMPGPVGEPGPPGKDGTAGLSFEGVYQDGQTYGPGQLATHGGSTWHCNATTGTKPGESKDWTLMVKRGRDGRDGKDAVVLPVVQAR